MSCGVVARLFSRRSLPTWRLQRAVLPVRTTVTSSTGAMKVKPKKHYSFGMVRLALVVVPFVYCGTVLGQMFAESLEKYDLFVPDDDDDD